MFCEKCGCEHDEDKECNSISPKTAKNEEIDESDDQTEEIELTPAQTKFYSVLSYFGILWFFVLFFPGAKNNPKVQFHIGQSIIISLFGVMLSRSISFITSMISMYVLPHGLQATKEAADQLQMISTTIQFVGIYVPWIVAILYMIFGIFNAILGKQNQLPVIGTLAFYGNRER